MPILNPGLRVADATTAARAAAVERIAAAAAKAAAEAKAALEPKPAGGEAKAPKSEAESSEPPAPGATPKAEEDLTVKKLPADAKEEAPAAAPAAAPAKDAAPAAKEAAPPAKAAFIQIEGSNLGGDPTFTDANKCVHTYHSPSDGGP